MASILEQNPPREAARKLQLVRAGGSQFGIFAAEISVIVPWQEPAPLPHAPSSVLGVVSVQGRMLTVLDLATLVLSEVSLSDGPRPAHGKLVALRGDEQLALAIEATGEIIQLGANESIDPISNEETAITPVLGFMRHEDQEIKILNLKKLFPAAIQGRERRQRRF